MSEDKGKGENNRLVQLMVLDKMYSFLCENDTKENGGKYLLGNFRVL